MNRRAPLFAAMLGLIAVVSIATSAATCGGSLPPPAAPDASFRMRPEVMRLAALRPNAAFTNTVAWLDVNNVTQVRALLAIARHLDDALGYPILAIDETGDAMPVRFWTLHHTLPIPHPTQAGRWAMPLDTQARTELLLLRARCAAVVDAGQLPDGGQVPAFCAPIGALPTPSATHDSTWLTLDAAAADRPWDAGGSLLPDDDYDGGTP